ncbi:small nuclear ribonucleoprotein-associated protein B'-like [Mustela lutreola]|uniref:small nuclear ribonucleoprotein-associated protein B'-like n=1 Tax=Mustela lutreola TaxID=9666 RepID=UPI0027977D2E|nr:small nuclear ribonucleoprotein-associated protein B'-like [Mustela lutreola]
MAKQALLSNRTSESESFGFIMIMSVRTVKLFRRTSSVLPKSAHPEFPRRPALAGRVLLHSPPGGSGLARLEPAGPRGGQRRGGGVTAGRAGRTPRARRRTGALAPALPHRLPLRTPTRTRGRRAPSREPADASAEARGIPGMRHRPPSAGHCRAPPGPPDHAPGHAPPTEQVGGRGQAQPVEHLQCECTRTNEAVVRAQVPAAVGQARSPHAHSGPTHQWTEYT